jgi:hypothetical protein
MSLDGSIAGPGQATDWVFGYVTPDEFPEIMTATGAMLVGRRTYEVGKRDAGDQHHTLGIRHHAPLPRTQIGSDRRPVIELD